MFREIHILKTKNPSNIFKYFYEPAVMAEQDGLTGSAWATGPTTLPLLFVPSRMNSVCRLQWVFGIQQGSPVMAALRTSSAVVPQKSSMAEFRCLQPWDTVVSLLAAVPGRAST